MLLLGVECTASPVSCALFEDERLISEYYLNTKTTHSQTLMPMIESSLKLCGRTPGDIDMFAVTAGPGSFTGVRIGVSAVKGMAEPFDKPCVPVSVRPCSTSPEESNKAKCCIETSFLTCNAADTEHSRFQQCQRK